MLIDPSETATYFLSQIGLPHMEIFVQWIPIEQTMAQPDWKLDQLFLANTNICR
jgi:hypothetical protein